MLLSNTQQIRVIEIIYSFSVAGTGGGAARFATALSRRLDPRHFEVTVCGLWGLGTPSEQVCMQELARAGIRSFVAAQWDGDRPYSAFWRAIRNTQSLLLNNPAQILHSHSEFGDVAAILLKAASDASIIVRTVHNGFHQEWRRRPLRRLLLTNALYPLSFAAEIGVNRSIVENLNRRWVASALGQQAIFIPNAIDLNRFGQTEIDVTRKRLTLGLPHQRPIVGCVGRLVEGKGYEILLEAAAIVLEDIPDAYFLLVGHGDRAHSLKLLAERLGISKHVILTGPRTDVEDLMRCMDLFVSPSLWEGLSTVILEAMASGIPVVATDIPGNQEMLEDDCNGWLVPANHPQTMAETIIDALRRPSVRQEYARRASRTVQDFSVDAVAEKHEELYLRLARRG